MTNFRGRPPPAEPASGRPERAARCEVGGTRGTRTIGVGRAFSGSRRPDGSLILHERGRLSERSETTRNTRNKRNTCSKNVEHLWIIPHFAETPFRSDLHPFPVLANWKEYPSTPISVRLKPFDVQLRRKIGFGAIVFPVCV